MTFFVRKFWFLFFLVLLHGLPAYAGVEPVAADVALKSAVTAYKEKPSGGHRRALRRALHDAAKSGLPPNPEMLTGSRLLVKWAVESNNWDTAKEFANNALAEQSALHVQDDEAYFNMALTALRAEFLAKATYSPEHSLQLFKLLAGMLEDADLKDEVHKSWTMAAWRMNLAFLSDDMKMEVLPYRVAEYAPDQMQGMDAKCPAFKFQHWGIPRLTEKMREEIGKGGNRLSWSVLYSYRLTEDGHVTDMRLLSEEPYKVFWPRIKFVSRNWFGKWAEKPSDDCLNKLYFTSQTFWID